MTKKVIDWPKPNALYASELIRLSEQYFDAFKALGQEATLERSYARYHLLGHSLELALKANLALAGFGRNELRTISHKLDRLLDECRKRALPDIQNLPDLVRHMLESHYKPELRYPEDDINVLPYPDQCVAIMDDLLQYSRSAIAPAALKANLDVASGTRHLRGSKIRLKN